MKRALILGITTALLITGSIASAPLPIKLYAGVGITKPTSLADFEDSWKDGFNVMGGVGLGMLPVVDVIAKVEYHQVGFDWDEISLSEIKGAISGDPSGNEFRLLTAGLEVRYALGVPTSSLKPFVFAGAGIARITYSDIENIQILVDPDKFSLSNLNKAYINFGAGLYFGVGGLFDLFLQIQQVKVTTEIKTSTLFPITVGIKL